MRSTTSASSAARPASSAFSTRGRLSVTVPTPSFSSYSTGASLTASVAPEPQDLARDHHALDLGGALADLGQLGVPEHALDRELGDVAGATVDLQRLGGHFHGRLRR